MRIGEFLKLQVKPGDTCIATYKDLKNHQIIFKVEDVTNNGTKSKLYIETLKNTYKDLETNKILSTHKLHYLGFLDISKIFNLIKK